MNLVRAPLLRQPHRARSSSVTAAAVTPARRRTRSLEQLEKVSNNWDTGSIDGTLMRDWVGAAMTTPAAVTDRTEEGTLVADYPGVQPFPCDIAP